LSYNPKAEPILLSVTVKWKCCV